jgi:ATP synthase protein I
VTTALGASRVLVRRWFVCQLALVALVGLLSLLIKNIEFAVAVLLGGMICFIPNLVFARSWLSFFSARHPQHMLIMFYCGEAIKFFLMVILFILAFKFLAVAVLPVLLGFASGQVGLFLGSTFKNST